MKKKGIGWEGDSLNKSFCFRLECQFHKKMPIEKEKATKSEQRDNGDIKECVYVDCVDRRPGLVVTQGDCHKCSVSLF